MSNDSLTVTVDQLAELLRGLGLDPVDMADIRSIHAEFGRVEVVRSRRDEQGRHYFAGRDIATETVVIAITDAPRQPVAVDVTTLRDSEPRYVVG
jgi:hypothetical protein